MQWLLSRRASRSSAGNFGPRLGYSSVHLVATFACLVLAVLCGLSFFAGIRYGSSKVSTVDRSACFSVLSEGQFRGAAPWRSAKTVAAITLFETPWLRLEDHTIRVHSPGGTESIVEHWKWMDVADQINVLVSVTRDTWERYSKLRLAGGAVKGGSKEDDRRHYDDTDDTVFLLFHQEKYGYEGLSFAVVGGLLEPQDASPLAGAMREVKEELGLELCHEWVPLGSFRTDVNRGGGIVHSFHARNCAISDEALVARPQEESVRSDLEAQRPVAFGAGQLRSLVLRTVGEHDNAGGDVRDGIRAAADATPRETAAAGNGGSLVSRASWRGSDVKEVKWSHTIALALLRLEERKAVSGA